MPEHYGATQRLAARPVQVPRRSALGKAAAVTLASVTVTLAAIAALLAPGAFQRGPAELLAGSTLPPLADPLRAQRRASGTRRRSAAGFVMPPFAGDLRGAGLGGSLPPGPAARKGQHSLRSSLVAALPPMSAALPPVPPHFAPLAPPEAWMRKVPATKDYEHVRFHKVPTGEVAYYGDARYGPWFAEHKHEDATEGDEGEINTYPSDCTGGCDLRQSRMLEAAEGMVKVALDTHQSREAAYTEQQERNVKWATRISKMLEQMVPAKPEGVCHRTVDCEECHGLTDEAECRQKLGIWVPHVSVMKEANNEAAKDQAKLNEEVGCVSVCWCGCSCALCRCQCVLDVC
jgi:hypothetical protein